MLGLRFCARAFSSCGEQGPLFIAVRRPLTIAASLVAEHRLQTRSLSSCGSRAQLFRGMWDPPRPGLEPVSPALAGGFPTTVPPGKPPFFFFFILRHFIAKGIFPSEKTLSPPHREECSENPLRGPTAVSLIYSKICTLLGLTCFLRTRPLWPLGMFPKQHQRLKNCSRT